MIFKYATGFAGAVLLSACSMSGLVHNYSVDYTTAMEQFANEDILTNLLRARDGAPLHFSELSQVTGSIQAQIQLATTAYFGQNLRSAKSADQTVPTLSFNSSPTFDVSPLDTEAFSIGILQPVDPSYISMYWNSGNLPKELVFDLFVSSIENSNNCNAAFYPSAWEHDELKNNPETNENLPINKNPNPVKGENAIAEEVKNQREYFKDQNCSSRKPVATPLPSTFQSYLSYLMDKHITLKTLTVMTPLGNQFDANLKATDLKDLTDETTTHLGWTTKGKLQIYRRWNDQLALCVDVQKNDDTFQYSQSLLTDLTKGSAPHPIKPRHAIAPHAASGASDGQGVAPNAELNLLAGQAHVDLFDLRALASTIDSSKAKSASKKAPKATASTSASKSGNTTPTAQLPTPAVPLIGMLTQRACRQQEIVVSSTEPEGDVATDSSESLQIQVRSVQGVMEYIGRTLRLLKFDNTGAMTWRGGDKNQEIFFRLFDTRDHLTQAGLALRATVKDADGTSYFAGTPIDNGSEDHTMQVLALLNSLINSNKVSGDIPTTKQVQVVP